MVCAASQPQDLELEMSQNVLCVVVHVKAAELQSPAPVVPNC